MSKKKLADSTNLPTRREFLAGAGGAALIMSSNSHLPVFAQNKGMPEKKSDIGFLEKYPTSLLESAIYLITGTHAGIIFTGAGLVRRTSGVKRVVGYAVTCEFSTDPDDERGRKENAAYWDYVFRQPAPKLAVAVDVSRKAGTGSSWGQLNGHIHKGLGCSGVLTNGGVRDINVFEEIGLTVFSGSLTIAHGNPHFVRFGEPVMLYGARISPGDVVAADEHGAIVIPRDAIPYIEEAVAETTRRVSLVAEYCKQPGFTPAGLIKAAGRMKPSVPWKPSRK